MMVLAGLALTTIYMTAVNSWTVADAACGAALASLGLLRFRSFVLPHPSRLRSRGLGGVLLILNLIRRLLASFVRGAGRVLAALVDARSEPGFVELPLEADSEAALALSVFMLTVAPDSFVVDVDRERRVVIAHVIDVRRADRIRAEYVASYRRDVRPLFADA